ncbi:unnamed protein product [Acanthoscelides obtectus]|uniref:Uncharacterized protein n=1 Tax=Acanthoscelides obtectus TaxID=200917 RepID=A0A9P0Q928_ACAOB|nr:unnamed protein product [Acanthoscelides obtectus]CAK1658903.1 hypothetical protein AOBTE_LOCUS21189 [Acanthoscelides obtectus]
MSVLKHAEIHKKITEKEATLESEFIGPLNRYNEENHRIFNRKSEQFKEAVRQLTRLNEETFNINRKRLQNDYRALVNCDFLEDDTGEEISVPDEHTPVCLRKRPVRQIDEKVTKKQFVCTMEPWFKRYSILNKFIQATRVVIIQNRLRKNLEKLKVLDEKKITEFEDIGFRYINVSYPELFEKFLK